MKHLSYFGLIVALLLVFACGGQNRAQKKRRKRLHRKPKPWQNSIWPI